MKTFREIFNLHNGRLVHKWDHYFEIYDKFFSKYIGTEVNFMEIGISHGGSLQIWREYFGEKANIFAVDINPECKKFEDEKTKIFIGSQEDKVFLNSLSCQIPKLDILLDDGGHTMNQQITSFKTLFESVKDNGVYMIEDTHTSYWYAFHGGLKNKNSLIEYSKDLVDNMHAWHIDNEKKMPISDFTKSILGISFYDSIVAIEKCKRNAPFHIMKGEESIFSPYSDPTHKKETILMQVLKKISSKKQNSFEKQLVKK